MQCRPSSSVRVHNSSPAPVLAMQTVQAAAVDSTLENALALLLPKVGLLLRHQCSTSNSRTERDGGCGFGDSQPNDDAAVALGFTGSAATSPASGGDTSGSTATNNSSSTSSNVDDSAAGAESVGNGNGAQFITGECTSDADCASGCCGFNSGKCAGAVIALSRDGGCGFGDSSPNDDAAQAMGFTGGISSSSTGGSTSSSSTTPDTSSSSNSTSDSDSGSTDNSSGSTGGSTGSGSQFITGPCTSDADCASGCCGFNSGKCAGPVVAQERDGGVSSASFSFA